jgi:hypothetical protein
MYYVSSFDSGSYTFPSNDIPSSKKRSDPNWSLDNLKAIYSYGLNDPHGAYKNGVQIATNRSYGAGNQDITKYIDVLDPLVAVFDDDGNVKSEKRMNYGKIDYTIKPVLPKYRNEFIGMLCKKEHYIDLQATDEASSNLKKSKKAELEIRMRFSEEIQAVHDYIGLSGQNEYVPQSKEELEVYYEMGADKLDYEIGMESVVGDAFGQSDWDDIQEKIYGDFFDNNESATWDDININTMRMECHYADPGQVILEHVQNRSYKNSTFGGIVMDYTINKLRSETGWSEEKIQTIATQYKNTYGNNLDKDLHEYTHYELNGNCNYNNFIIPVLLGRWKSIDYDFENAEVEIKNKAGVKPSELRSGKIYEKDGSYFKKVAQGIIPDSGVEVVYHGKWVVNTEYVFDYGIMPFQPRAGKGTELGIRKYRLQGKSICERLIPNADNIQIAWCKYQKGLADAPSRGEEYDFDALTETASAMKGTNPMQLMALRRRGTGDIALKRKSGNLHMQGQGYNGSINQIKGGMGGQLDEIITIFRMNIAEIEAVSGMANVTTGNPANGQPVGTSEMLIESTGNAMKTAYEGYKRLKVGTARSIILRAQSGIEGSPKIRNAYEKVIGKVSTSAIAQAEMENNNPVSWGIVIQAMPSKEERDKIEQRLQIAIAVGRDGKPILSTADTFHISRMLNTPNGLKAAERFCAIQENKRKIQDDKAKQDDMKFQGDINARNAQLTEEEKRKTDDVMTQNAIKKYYFEKLIDTKISMPAELEKELILNGIQIAQQQTVEQPPEQPL